MGVEGLNCVVTGGSGFVGQRLVEMLVERGAKKYEERPTSCFNFLGKRNLRYGIISMLMGPVLLFFRVVSFDVVERPMDVLEDDRILYIKGDIGNPADVERAVEGADCVWHVAALVGPFHPFERYERVNYYGTLNVIEACKKLKVTY